MDVGIDMVAVGRGALVRLFGRDVVGWQRYQIHVVNLWRHARIKRYTYSVKWALGASGARA